MTSVLPAGASEADTLNIKELRNRFQMIDKNGDGLISREELRSQLLGTGMESVVAQHMRLQHALMLILW